ncbi:peptidoglycan editing factor PgeF [Candidatus Sumerlaeota bacterium]|nr:peptidoglycan editing factor PgeF [Candidatus Sumerlaeota bacterium]
MSKTISPALASSVDSFIAAYGPSTKSFVSFTTNRDFDPDINTPWQESAERLAELVESRTGCDGARIVFAGQVHGRNVMACMNAQAGIDRVENCDALITNTSNVLLVIRTADCVPLVLLDEQAHICAAVHAGWKGTLENVTAATVEHMQRLGASAGRIRAWVGPAISEKCYEVGGDVLSQFQSRHGKLGCFTNESRLDLAELNVLQAIEAGIPSEFIARSNLCTYSLKHLFHSHRRQGTLRGHQFTICGFLDDRK